MKTPYIHRPFSYEGEIETKAGLIIPCSCEYRVSWGYPAKTTGLPEDCHPGEPDELEDCLFRIDDSWLVTLLTENVPADACRTLRRKLEAKFFEQHEADMLAHARAQASEPEDASRDNF